MVKVVEVVHNREIKGDNLFWASSTALLDQRPVGRISTPKFQILPLTSRLVVPVEDLYHATCHCHCLDISCIVTMTL